MRNTTLLSLSDHPDSAGGPCPKHPKPGTIRANEHRRISPDKTREVVTKLVNTDKNLLTTVWSVTAKEGCTFAVCTLILIINVFGKWNKHVHEPTKILFTHLCIIATLTIDGRKESVTFNAADFFGYDFQR